jgi:hypothetical protein
MAIREKREKKRIETGRTINTLFNAVQGEKVAE